MQTIRGLPEDDRALVRLLYYEERSSDEIAEMLGMKASTLRSRIARIRDRLRRDFERRWDDE